MNCPIDEQTADGDLVGRCYLHLPDGKTCPRHGDVGPEVDRFNKTRVSTAENVMRSRKGLPLLGHILTNLPEIDPDVAREALEDYRAPEGGTAE